MTKYFFRNKEEIFFGPLRVELVQNIFQEPHSSRPNLNSASFTKNGKFEGTFYSK